MDGYGGCRKQRLDGQTFYLARSRMMPSNEQRQRATQQQQQQPKKNTMAVNMNFECPAVPTEKSRQNYGILCHRQYADRIREALLPSNSGGWQKLASGTDTSCRANPPPSRVVESSGRCEVIPTPYEPGPRKSRNGYALLVVQGAVMSPSDLPPMARKQISWAGRLTHQESMLNVGTVCNEDTSKMTETDVSAVIDLQMALKPIIPKIWSDLSKSFHIENDFLRVDVQPKAFNSEVCDAFTTFINGMGHESPIKLARSASKVSHVVNITIQSTSSPNIQSPTMEKIYWGISKGKDHFEYLNQRLNDYATNEVILESTCSKTGDDSNSNIKGKEVPWDAPVSRAYYKLAQVFEDDNLLQLIASLHINNSKAFDTPTKSILSHAAGLDIGASPGGWTQVLHNTLGLPAVVAIDPGILAQRVMVLKGVHHLRTELSTEESIKSLAQYAPYSTIVCDASVSNANELLVKIVETLDKVSSLLKKLGNDGNTSSPNKNVFAFPLCLVITLKLPYKTIGSIERNLEKVNDYLPDYLRRIALLGSSSSGDDVDVQYKICHLFANSISERTLIAVSNKK